MAITGYSQRSQAAGWPEHPLRVLRDPDAEKYSWAQPLWPDLQRKVLLDETLSERLISTVADCNKRLVEEGYGSRPLCIAGSRVLQRIIGARYLGKPGRPDRVLYPATDIDVWVRDSASLHRLTQMLELVYKAGFHRLCTLNLGSGGMREELLPESRRYKVLESPFSRQDVGLYYHPMFFHGRADDPHLFPFLAKVDASCPLDYGLFDEPDPECPDLDRLTDAGKNRALVLQAIDGCIQCPMAVALGHSVLAPALSDMQYLASLRDALTSKNFAESIRAKMTGSVLPVMLYLEATRKLCGPAWQADDFCRYLLRLCAGQIPESVGHLDSLLRAVRPALAERVARLTGLAVLPVAPKISCALPGKKVRLPLRLQQGLSRQNPAKSVHPGTGVLMFRLRRQTPWSGKTGKGAGRRKESREKRPRSLIPGRWPTGKTGRTRKKNLAARLMLL